MTYEYEFVTNGIVKRRTTAEFRPNVIALGVEDLLDVNTKIDLFEIRVRKLKNWKEAKEKIAKW